MGKSNSRDDLLRISEEWSLPATIARLAGAANHLLRDHDCDAHGYEGVTSALRAAEAWLKEEGYGSLLEEGWDRFCIMKHREAERAEAEKVAKETVEKASLPRERPMAAAVNWAGLGMMLGMSAKDVKKAYLTTQKSPPPAPALDGTRPCTLQENLTLHCDLYDGSLPAFALIVRLALKVMTPIRLADEFEVSENTILRWASGEARPRPRVRHYVADVLYARMRDIDWQTSKPGIHRMTLERFRDVKEGK